MSVVKKKPEAHQTAGNADHPREKIFHIASALKLSTRHTKGRPLRGQRTSSAPALRLFSNLQPFSERIRMAVQAANLSFDNSISRTINSINCCGVTPCPIASIVIASRSTSHRRGCPLTISIRWSRSALSRVACAALQRPPALHPIPLVHCCQA